MEEYGQTHAPAASFLRKESQFSIVKNSVWVRFQFRGFGQSLEWKPDSSVIWPVDQSQY